VEQARHKDAEQGLKIAQVLEGHIHRKVIKQTVMTTVYGVTRFGARLQIARQLKGKYEGYVKHIYTVTTVYDKLNVISHTVTFRTFVVASAMCITPKEFTGLQVQFI
jgi:DNA-directed RNA polymerase